MELEKILKNTIGVEILIEMINVSVVGASWAREGVDANIRVDCLLNTGRGGRLNKCWRGTGKISYR